MVKFSNLIGTLFNKSSTSKLETDAAPLPPRQKADAYEEVTMARTNTSPAAVATQNGNFPNGNGIVGIVPGIENVALVPSSSQQSLALISGEHHLTTPQTVVNNVQHNTLTAPQTSISNTTGMQVYQIRNANNLHIGNSYTFNTAVVDEGASTSGSLPGGGSSVKWANLRLSNTITQMMRSQEEVDTDIMDTVSRHLGYEWKSFARRLEYSEGQIDAFEADNSTLAEQIYSFVLDWTRNDDDPTLGRLVTLLWNNKHKETVYYIKQVWKKRKEDDYPPNSSS
uniref:Death domain-containing protein n=1 Tax=Anopheles christyi TaxID=43041 RepID=A0A182KFM2_9DIPT